MDEENKAADTEQQETQTEEQNQDTRGNDVKSEAQKIADAIVAKKLKGMPSKEELKAYKEWQENQKTEEQKQSEAMSAAEQAKQKAEARAAAAEAKAACLMAGVAVDYVDDAMVLAQHLVDDNTDINAAIKKVVDKYPTFKGTSQTQPTITTGAKSAKATTENSEDAARAVMGLPPK